MKFSEQWLREWVNPDISTDEMVAMLTMAGLEVDGVEPAAGEFTGVMVGEVLAMEAHPDADKLRVCQVKVADDDVRQIVCGAANVHVGMHAPLAEVGARLPGGLKIKKAKLRGVESLGMLCSTKELGMTESADGLMPLPTEVLAGTNLRDYLSLDDQVIDVDLTPNRGDCLSIAGVARDLGVLTRTDVTRPEIIPVSASIDDTFPVDVKDTHACPRYLGRVIRGVNTSAMTPMWMQEKLRRSGIRSLGPLVDVTNYVLLELGQPMHAFDLNQLNGGIQVRHANTGETLTLLDGKELKLDDKTLVIADANGPLALAGIMGGENSGCSDDTKDLFLECAYFNPLAIAGRAREYGLHTDSSHRFERGVDPQLSLDAMERATGLLLEITGGEAGPVVDVTCDADLPKPAEIHLRRSTIKRLLGIEMADAEVVEILERLGMEVDELADGWQVKAPTYRFDMAIEADLIEELARVYGYDNVPSNMPSGRMLMPEVPENRIEVARLRNLLVDRDYQEAITYSFVEPGLQSAMDPINDAIALANPISADLSVMRTTLWTGLLSALVHNQKRQHTRIRLFETGLSFQRADNEIVQVPKLAGVITGPTKDESWTGHNPDVDFFDMKGDVEALLSITGDMADVRFEASEHPALHPGQSARIRRGDTVIGWVGAIHPDLMEKFDAKGNVFAFEIEQAAMAERKPIAFEALSRFPSIRRDIAVIVDQTTPVQALIDTVKEASGTLLIDLILFDVYSGEGVESGRKSIALGLILQDSSRTLVDSDVDEVMAKVVEKLSENHAAVLRD